MRFVVFDGTAVKGVTSGPGRAAQFSTPTVDYIRSAGHDVVVCNGFDVDVAESADAVWTEWCNETAFAAAATGVCKKLIVRMRGYDVWLPLDRMNWANVDGLVFESEILRRLAFERFPFLRNVRSMVIASGIDLTKWPYKQRSSYGRTFAIFARADYRKGHNLAIEFARQNPQFQIHTTLALPQSNPRLVEYLRSCAPSNFHVHNNVPNIAEWVDSIDANFLLSTAFWEDFGYSIAEGMALGLKPLIYAFPNADLLWPEECLWRDLVELKDVIEDPYPVKGQYRRFVEDHLDGVKQSALFLDFVEQTSQSTARSTTAVAAKPKRRVSFSDFLVAVEKTSQVDFQKAEQLVIDFCKEKLPGSAEIRAYACMLLVRAALNRDENAAQTWCFQALSDGPRVDAFCVLGELEAQKNNVDAALTWYDAANAVTSISTDTPLSDIVAFAATRRRDMRRISCGVDLTLLRTFNRYLVEGVPFSFAKFGDGEWQCVAGCGGQNADRHHYSEGLAQGLVDAFQFLANRSDVYIADWVGPYRDMRDHLVQQHDLKPQYAPYHLLLIGRDNLRPELLDFYKAVRNCARPKVFVGPAVLKVACLALRASEFVAVPEVNAFDSLAAIKACLDETAEQFRGLKPIYLFTAGMPAKLLIAHVLRNDSNATCLDLGSALDPLFKGQTRSGQPDPRVARAFFTELL